MLASCSPIPGEEGVGVGVGVSVGIGVIVGVGMGPAVDAVRFTSMLPPIVHVLVWLAVSLPTLKVTACPS